MASAAENTKIELVTEAFEQLAIAVAQGLILAERISTTDRPLSAGTPEMIAVQRADAREQMAEALREFMKPTLRVVAGPHGAFDALNTTDSRTMGDRMMGGN